MDHDMIKAVVLVAVAVRVSKQLSALIGEEEGPRKEARRNAAEETEAGGQLCIAIISFQQ